MVNTLDKPTEKYYQSIIHFLNKHHFKFMVGGGISVMAHSSVVRPIKDLDIFVKAGDYPKILTALKEAGFRTAVRDERWLAKVNKGSYHVDIIFSSPNYINQVDDSWFSHARDGEIFGIKVKMVGPEEIIWCKAYVQERNWYDGADINHLILSKGKDLDWKHLLNRFETHWEILLGVLLNFRFVYPSERGIVPKSLMQELMQRLSNQLQNPIPRDKICRGPLISRSQYEVDLNVNGFEFIK